MGIGSGNGKGKIFGLRSLAITAPLTSFRINRA